MSTARFTLKVGGSVVPITEVDIHGSSAGHTGHLSADVGIGALDDAGIDLVKMAIDAPANLEVNAYVQIDGVTTQLFGGEYLSAKYHYNQQLVKFRARDWSGPLVDQKRVLVNILSGNAGSLAPGEVEGRRRQHPESKAVASRDSDRQAVRADA